MEWEFQFMELNTLICKCLIVIQRVYRWLFPFSGEYKVNMKLYRTLGLNKIILPLWKWNRGDEAVDQNFTQSQSSEMFFVTGD